MEKKSVSKLRKRRYGGEKNTTLKDHPNLELPVGLAEDFALTVL